MPASRPASPQKATCREPEQLIDTLRQQVIGRDTTIQTPFGERPLLYCDHTASGRSLASIESAIARDVLPHYANTHSEASHTGRHTGQLRGWARQTIKDVINAGPEDALIFCGSGATSAVNTLVHLLGLKSGDTRQSDPSDEAPTRALVLIGPYEHHSNELPWRETAADVIRIPLDPAGGIDQRALTETLQQHRNRSLVIGSFSAASNVTGIQSDVHGITQILKEHGALAIWDYAAGAPYLPINMNRENAPLDAVFFSPHKFIGGPGSSGVLAVKRQLLKNTVPSQIGGGTVRYVTPYWHEWHPQPEHREEGGTPGIIESIRGAMAISIPKKVGYEVIAEKEKRHVERARVQLQEAPGLELLGPANAERLPIFSLRFRSDEGELHYGFVVRLLNDLFGIQARGGCSCAGPYAHTLLDLTPEHSEALAAEVRRGFGCLRPGWVRFNLHWLSTEEEVDYVLRAMTLIARWGSKLLPSYTLDTKTGLWQHRDFQVAPPASLDDFMLAEPPKALSATCASPVELLDIAQQALSSSAPHHHHLQATEAHHNTPWPSQAEALCWFLRPHDGC
jgi:selenocysteine lyase/cysteine desulfurase